MYSTVPSMFPTAVTRTLPKSRAMPKSESLICAVAGQQQVGRLDVAMDDAAVVGVAQGPAGIDADPGHLAPVESAAAAAAPPPGSLPSTSSMA